MKRVDDKRKIAALSVTFLLLCVLAIVIALNFGFLFSNQNKAEQIIGTDFVEMIDVGQGDSFLISSGGYTALIDTGLSNETENVCQTLDSYGITKIDVLLITHFDSDHSGGLKKITEIYRIENLIIPEISIESEDLPSSYAAIAAVTKGGGNIHNAKQGMNFKIGNFNLTVLASFSDMKEENNRSTVVMAETGDKKFLFTGDLEEKGEKALLEEGLNLKCDVLKVGHHGSSSSTTEEFLKAAKPQIAAISVGENNTYGHPHNEILSLLEYNGCTVYRTDTMGNVIFTIKNGKITVKTER